MACDISRNIFFITLSNHDDNKNVLYLKKSIHDDIHDILYDKEIGNISKIKKTREYVESATHIRDTDIIVYVDGYDEICLKYDKEEMIRKFLETGMDILFGAEKNFANAKEHLRKEYNKLNDKYSYKYLNAGSQIGFKGQWLKMMKYVEENIGTKYHVNENKSDQMILSEFFIDNQKLQICKIGLDTMCTFFATNPPLEDEDDFKRVNSFFIHITALKYPEQQEIYDRLISYYFK